MPIITTKIADANASSSVEKVRIKRIIPPVSERLIARIWADGTRRSEKAVRTVMNPILTCRRRIGACVEEAVQQQVGFEGSESVLGHSRVSV